MIIWEFEHINMCNFILSFDFAIIFFQTGMSYACGNGFLPILELLNQLEELDPNLPDKDSNTPLIFAAQAGS